MVQTAERIHTLEESRIEEEGRLFQKYDITSSPNDFNVRTIVDFIEQGIYTWPQKLDHELRCILEQITQHVEERP